MAEGAVRWRSVGKVLLAVGAFLFAGAAMPLLPVEAGGAAGGDGASGAGLAVPRTSRSVSFESQTVLPLTGVSGARGLEVDAAGNVYLADQTRVIKWSPPSAAFPSGRQVTLPFVGLTYVPDVAVSASGVVYASDPRRRQILRLVPSGIPVGSQYGSQTVIRFDSASPFFDPEGIAVGSDDTLFVIDQGGNQVLARKATGAISVVPVGMNEFGQGIEVNANGDLIATTSSVEGPGEVRYLAKGGSQQILPFSGMGGVNGADIDSGRNIYAVDAVNGGVYRRSSTGAVTTMRITGLETPSDVEVDAAGRVYVSDFWRSRVVVYTPGIARINVTPKILRKGWLVGWTGVPGASKYYIDRRYRAGGGWTRVRELGSSLRLATVSEAASGTSLQNGNTYEEFRVRAVNSAGVEIGSGTSKLPCAPVFFISARGSGQNLGGTQEDRDYAYGLGSRGEATYSNIKAQLGVGDSSIRAVPILPPYYPAVAVKGGGLFPPAGDYLASVQGGTERTATVLRTIAANCAGKSKIYMFGYSQGAHVIGNAYQLIANPTTEGMVSRVSLFADPLRRSADPHVAALPDDPGSSGALGSRPPVRAVSPRKVASWCWSDDFVCKRGGTSFHGDIYDCHEEWEGLLAAGNLAPWLPNRQTATKVPSCDATP